MNFLVTMEKRKHTFPSRTRQWNASSPMVLRLVRGRVGRCQVFFCPFHCSCSVHHILKAILLRMVFLSFPYMIPLGAGLLSSWPWVSAFLWIFTELNHWLCFDNAFSWLAFTVKITWYSTFSLRKGRRFSFLNWYRLVLPWRSFMGNSQAWYGTSILFIPGDSKWRNHSSSALHGWAVVKWIRTLRLLDLIGKLCWCHGRKWFTTYDISSVTPAVYSDKLFFPDVWIVQTFRLRFQYFPKE